MQGQGLLPLHCLRHTAWHPAGPWGGWLCAGTPSGVPWAPSTSSHRASSWTHLLRPFPECNREPRKARSKGYLLGFRKFTRPVVGSGVGRKSGNGGRDTLFYWRIPQPRGSREPVSGQRPAGGRGPRTCGK